MSLEYRLRLARLWRTVVAVPEGDIFAANPDLRRHARRDDALPQPGYVGRQYHRGGILFIAANPGGAQVPNLRSDVAQNRLIRQLQQSTSRSCVAPFAELMHCLRETMPQDWRIYRNCVQPVLQGTGYDVDDIAYLNLVKWRTRAERLSAAVIDASSNLQTGIQVSLLRPKLIVALGSAAGHYLQRVKLDAAVFMLKRLRGDHRLADEGMVEAIRARRWIIRRR